MQSAGSAIADKKAGKSFRYRAEESNMKLSLVVIAVLCLSCVNLFAQGKIELQSSDTVHSVLEKNMGGTVELRLKSGEKIGGKLEKLGDKLVQLSQLTGAEFYDAAVEIADVSVVVVRMKK